MRTLLTSLQRLELFDDAHVIFTADHGEAFGEHDSLGPGRSLHLVEARVPLFWKLPAARREEAGCRAESDHGPEIAPARTGYMR